MSNKLSITEQLRRAAAVNVGKAAQRDWDAAAAQAVEFEKKFNWALAIEGDTDETATPADQAAARSFLIEIGWHQPTGNTADGELHIADEPFRMRKTITSDKVKGHKNKDSCVSLTLNGGNRAQIVHMLKDIAALYELDKIIAGRTTADHKTVLNLTHPLTHGEIGRLEKLGAVYKGPTIDHQVAEEGSKIMAENARSSRRMRSTAMKNVRSPKA